jgi:hypothetical protein
MSCGPSPKTGDSLNRSLGALGHPISLALIGLLLVNDHLLKPLAPSVLTGKASDFAGLFFFPYLLAAFLSLVERAISRLWGGRSRARWSESHSAGKIEIFSTIATGLLFAIVKVIPAVNAAANDLLARVSGLPVRIAYDPSDLVALLALAPSIALLVSVKPTPAPSVRRSLVALSMASLAVIATSPCPPEQPVTHLVSTEQGVYALATAWDPISSAYLSPDQGRTWEYREPETLPASILAVATDPVKLPKIVCAPAQDQVCYRITGEERLEVSGDGGRTWQIAWSVPASRRAYMARVASGYGRLLACGKDIDLRADDIVVVGEGQDHIAIVAQGNEGVLRGRYGDAEWDRIGVGWTEPTPMRGDLGDLLPPMIISGESVAALVVATAVFILFSVMAWRRLDPGGEHPEKGRRRRSPWVVGIAVDLCLLVVLVLINMEELISMVAAPLFIVTMVIVSMVAGWSKAIQRATSGMEARRALRTVVCAALLAGSLGWAPFALWVIGAIPGYSAALIMGVVIVILVTAYTMGRLPKSSRPADSAG